ncbi:unnamed protein product [Notodromas monacha]|uniref:Uncharacterized protein n=1 Tax=Notodromas monacha TaxID=399045 RepID=A0A7R9BK05_9CRUS|nr:unnamed protein product [Notodromas monacha]CAG0915560.1 unnamed protein product [Notodromas monacha]
MICNRMMMMMMRAMNSTAGADDNKGPLMLLKMMLVLLVVAAMAAQLAAAADPCLELTDSVAPCTCADSVLDCSGIRSGAQLLTIAGLQNGQSLGFEEIRILANPLVMDIPDGAFGAHYAVHTINFMNNKDLLSISGSIFRPESKATLGTLIVRDNKVESFPFSALQGFTNLTTIRLDGNRLTSIPNNAFDGLISNVELLNLDNNLISSIGEFAFSNIESVQEITLKNNQLERLGTHALHLSAPVATVSVSKNLIASVDPDFLSGLLPGNTVLSSNLITSLPQDQWGPALADSLTSSARLSFTDNQFVCDCGMKWLFDVPAAQAHFFNILCSNILNPSTGQPWNLWLAGVDALGECP